MPSFNFQKQFARDVKRGRKRQTIRAKRKNRPRVGQVAHCFTGMRTKACSKLGAWRIAAVWDLKIFDEGVLLEGAAIRADELDVFARRDGFGHWPGMLVWFAKTHGLPFYGDLIRWEYTGGCSHA